MEAAIRFVRRTRRLLKALAAASLVVPLVAFANTAAAGAASESDAVPHYDHIVVIMFTDHSYANILNNKYAPTFNRLAKAYGLATRYYTTSDPDVAGMMAFLAGNDYGVSDGAPYWDQPVNKPSLLSQLVKAGLSWKEYVQNLPYAGYLGDCYPTVCQETDSLYKQEKFNPVPDLTYVADNPAQARNIVPGSQLGVDARTGRLPNLSFVDANECTNMHGGPPWCQDSPNLIGEPDDNKLVAGGDAYLRQVTAEILAGPQWRHGNNAIVITETEGTTSAGCCDANPGTGQVFTVVVTSHGPRHLKDATPFNHFSLLATVEHAFGLGCLQFACDTKHVLPMSRLFGGLSDGPESFPHGKNADAASEPPSAGPAARTAAAVARGPAAPASSPWSVVPTPNTGTNDNDLWSISGRSPSDIWAVGSLLPNANATVVQTLALHYNGSTWKRVSTPDFGHEANSLYGVAALPDGTAWATGIYTQASGHTGQALTEHWNGHAWAIVPAANPGSADDMLYSVTAVRDADVWAVGTYGGANGYFHPLIEHWNGHRWSADRVAGLSPSAHGILSSVTSAGHGGVWAAGQLSGADSDSQVVLHLVGGTWVIAHENPVRSHGGDADAYPLAIASSAGGLWVAGRDRSGHDGFLTFVEGPGAARGQLRQLSTPNPTPQDNYLWGITPVGGGQHAWAVGDSVPVSTGNAASLIEYGSASGGWRTVPSPDPGAPNGNTILDGVLAFSPTNVWAVGTYDGKGGMKTLIMHYAGGKL
jgi:hypothetical protein